MMNKLKLPEQKTKKGKLRAPPEQKKPSSNQEKPLFSFQYLEADYNVKNCQKDDKAALAEQLESLGSKTWQELQQAPKHGLGFEKINQDAIRAPLPAHLKGDKAVNFIAFRFSGKKPMIGYRQDQTYYIIWVDKDFSLYNHG